MPGPFNPPLVRVQENLTPDQRTRAAALLVAQQARPMGTADEHLRLADYVVHGGIVLSQQEQRRSPLDLFGHRQMDLDNEAGLRGELVENDDLDEQTPEPTWLTRWPNRYPTNEQGNPHANAPFEAP